MSIILSVLIIRQPSRMATPQHSGYPYQRLNSESHEIRTLTLLPGAGSDAIRCTLEQASLGTNPPSKPCLTFGEMQGRQGRSSWADSVTMSRSILKSHCDISDTPIGRGYCGLMLSASILITGYNPLRLRPTHPFAAHTVSIQSQDKA